MVADPPRSTGQDKTPRDSRPAVHAQAVAKGMVVGSTIAHRRASAHQRAQQGRRCWWRARRAVDEIGVHALPFPSVRSAHT